MVVAVLNFQSSLQNYPLSPPSSRERPSRSRPPDLLSWTFPSRPAQLSSRHARLYSRPPRLCGYRHAHRPTRMRQVPADGRPETSTGLAAAPATSMPHIFLPGIPNIHSASQNSRPPPFTSTNYRPSRVGTNRLPPRAGTTTSTFRPLSDFPSLTFQPFAKSPALLKSSRFPRLPSVASPPDSSTPALLPPRRLGPSFLFRQGRRGRLAFPQPLHSHLDAGRQLLCSKDSSSRRRQPAAVAIFLNYSYLNATEDLLFFFFENITLAVSLDQPVPPKTFVARPGTSSTKSILD